MIRPLLLLAMLCVASGVVTRVEAQDAPAAGTEKTPKSSGQQVVTTPNGSRVSWGFDLALLRLRSSRNAGEPGRYRAYKVHPDFVPGAFGFSVFVDPPGSPWRLRKGEFQFISVGALILVEKGREWDQSSVSIGLGLGFLDRFITLGMLFDLYRGVPVLGADGTRGGGTAETGLFAWAWSRQGEVTPENVSFVINLGLNRLVELVGSGGAR